MPEEQELRVLVVCLGNICRSPMGEAVLADIVKKRGLNIKVDSAGTVASHVGKTPDDRTVAVCKKYNVPINSTARQVGTSDFTQFTHILALDGNNLRELERIKPSNATAVVRLWGSYLDDQPIPDPYHEGPDGFEKIFQQVTKLSNAFLDSIVKK